MRSMPTAAILAVVLMAMGVLLADAPVAQGQTGTEAPRFEQSRNAMAYALFGLFTLAALYLVFRGSRRL